MGQYNGVELSDATVRGDRLVLRAWRPDDAPAVLAAMSDTSMHDFLALPRPYTAEDARQYVTGSGLAGRADGTRLGCAITLRETGQVAGAAELRLAGAPNVGYWVSPDMRGRGLAAEAVRMLARFGFGTLGLRRIELDCDVANTASVRTALAAGFAFEGVAREAAPVVARPDRSRPPGDLARFGRLATDDGLPIAPAFAALPAEGLGDGVIVLRPTAVDDLDGMVQTARDPVTRGWDFGGNGLDATELLRRSRRVGLDWLVGRAANLSIVDAATGRFAGEISLRLLGPPQTGAFGYSVHPDFRGRGYTTRALTLMSGWAFGIGFVYLGLGAKIDNIASQRAAEAAGFARTRVAPSVLRNPDGTFSDEAQYELLRPSR